VRILADGTARSDFELISVFFSFSASHVRVSSSATGGEIDVASADAGEYCIEATVTESTEVQSMAGWLSSGYACFVFLGGFCFFQLKSLSAWFLTRKPLSNPQVPASKDADIVVCHPCIREIAKYACLESAST
jgi:hypothetical protein